MELHEILRLAKNKQKKILLVLGDGIAPIFEMREGNVTKVTDRRYKNRLKEKDRENWLYFEHVRNFTRNELPLPSYLFIFLLARLGLLEAIVTTNYDMTLDTIFSRFSEKIKVPVVFNPVLNAGEKDHSGYCSEKPSSDSIRIWKIHGSLSHIICRKCETLFPCPDFVLPFDPEPITARFTYPISHLYLPGQTSCCPITQLPSKIKESLCGHYVHPIDWNFPKFSENPFFKRIINGALEEFDKDPFAIIILGFKGFLPRSRKRWHEEINVAAETLDGNNVLWAMYVSPEQDRKINDHVFHAHLWKLVKNNNGVQEVLEPDELSKKLVFNLVQSGLITMDELDNYDNIFRDAFIERGYYERIGG